MVVKYYFTNGRRKLKIKGGRVPPFGESESVIAEMH